MNQTAIDLLTIGAALFVVAACTVIAYRKGAPKINTNAWRQRAYYQTIVADVGAEYATARGMRYTSRDARALVRAYMHAHYPALTNEERNQVMRAAIAYGNQLHEHAPMIDINPRPRAA